MLARTEHQSKCRGRRQDILDDTEFKKSNPWETQKNIHVFKHQVNILQKSIGFVDRSAILVQRRNGTWVFAALRVARFYEREYV
jgi:hypothetical protein